MRAYFRVAPRFGVSMPWWAAIFVYVLWLTAAVTYWFCVATVWLVISAAQLLGWGWDRYQQHRTG